MILKYQSPFHAIEIRTNLICWNNYYFETLKIKPSNVSEALLNSHKPIFPSYFFNRSYISISMMIIKASWKYESGRTDSPSFPCIFLYSSFLSTLCCSAMKLKWWPLYPSNQLSIRMNRHKCLCLSSKECSLNFAEL